MTNAPAVYAAKLFAAGFVSGALTIGGLIGAATAHADPDPWAGTDAQSHDAALVCRWLDTNPTEGEIVDSLKRLLNNGLSTQTAGDTVVLAVSKYCPEYKPLFAAAYRDLVPGAGSSAARRPSGGVGGGIA